ncbi:MAG: phosphosulfolactate synthase [Mucinivorans sp.]
MNIELDFIPQRDSKPRTSGLTMVMDKGLSPMDARSLCSVAAHLIDYIKLGFGTSVFSDELKEKVDIYHQAGIQVYLGGTLLEACYVRGQMDKYLAFADELCIKVAEVSDGSMIIDHSQKCALIKQLSSRFKILSEVGSKVAGHEIPTKDWIEMMLSELSAGSSLVIAEAREAGNTGIFESNGCAKTQMIIDIEQSVELKRILWEAPQKGQQAWFIKAFGPQVNLGNIPSQDVVALETLRCGLRGDTFGMFLSEELKKKVQK